MPFTPIAPTWYALNGCNNASSSGQADPVTGFPYQGGNLVPGDWFDCTELEANNMSNTATGTCHAGRYRWVQVDSGATAANVKTGTIGYMLAGGQPQLNLVTSYDKSIVGAHPVIYLNSITPGNYGFVQEVAGGVGTVLGGASITKASPATGDLANSTTLGVVDDPTTQELTQNSIGVFLDPPNPNTLMRVYLFGFQGLG